MGVEVVGGLLADSLALIADAGHMFSDAGALGLTLFAMRFARRPATAQRTYGSYRAEILAALVNGATLVAVAMYIFIEAFERLRTPPEVQGGLMLAVASGGLLVNAAGLWILHTGHEQESYETPHTDQSTTAQNPDYSDPPRQHGSLNVRGKLGFEWLQAASRISQSRGREGLFPRGDRDCSDCPVGAGPILLTLDCETLANLSKKAGLRSFTDEPVAEIVQCGEPAQ